MSKSSRMCHITPLPASVSREEAVAYLHNHKAMIELNPLVLRHERSNPHPNAEPDEAEGMTWYEITDMIQYVPGTPIKGEVSYRAGFYDVANGLQTHTWAPGGVELRGKWTVGGNAPGEKEEEHEIGSKRPRTGLYIQEDVVLRCNVFLTNFVKKNLKKSHATVVDSIVELTSSAHKRDIPVAKPENERSSSENSFSKGTRIKPPSRVSDGASTPTSYPQSAVASCECSMAAFGVHMDACSHYTRSQQQRPGSQSRSRSRPQSQSDSERHGDQAVELDGFPVATQNRFVHPTMRPAELE